MKILQLLIDNREKKRDFRINQKDREAIIYIYDVIGDDYYGGISAKQFAAQVAALDVDTIHLRINSPGGDVFAGVAMGIALKEHKAYVIAYIDGQAASAATRLTTAADEVRIAPGAFYMIHNSWTIAIGDHREFTKTAKLLSDVDQTINADYQSKTGKSAEEIQKWMDDETWFNADDAVANGFADSLIEPQSAEADSDGANNRWNLSAYDNVPKALKSQPKPKVDEAAAALRAANERRLTLLERIAA